MTRHHLATVLAVAVTMVFSLLTGVGTAAAATPEPTTNGTGRAAATTRSCVYSAHSIAELDRFAKLVGQPVDCATVFNDSSTNWAGWSSPWFTRQTDPDLDWAGWVRAKAGRQLIVTQNLFPTSEQSSNWLLAGSRGAYDQYAVQLARNLVASGLGASTIRLANEANGTWYPYSVPADVKGQRQWRTFWANTVTAMRSVPGADFRFAWTVNYQVRDLSLAAFYPGNQFVDVIGLDAYDMGSGATTSRFTVMRDRPGGIAAVLAFAAARKRPVAFPEWGLMPAGAPKYGGGDDPGYIAGMASVMATQRVAFEGYWYAHADTMSLLENSPDSLAELRKLLATLR